MDSAVARSRSKIPAELIQAYRDAVYRVATLDQALELKVDRRSPELAALYAIYGCNSACFITACNPLSQLRSTELNREANTRLRGELERVARAIFDSDGSDSEGEGPREPGFLALGIDEAQAAGLGRDYEQNAVLWAGADAIPRLMLLR